MALTLTPDEREELERRVRSRKIRAEDARRARLVLMLAAGDSYGTIGAALDCYPNYISRWKRRFEVDRLDGLRAKYCGQPPTVRTPAMEARILEKTRQRPPDGSTHWSTRKLARACSASVICWSPASGDGPVCSRIGSSATCSPTIRTSSRRLPMSSACICSRRGTPPSSPSMRKRRFKRLTDSTPSCRCRRVAPNVTASSITATALSLFAALNTRTGEIVGQTVPRHTSAAFVEFLADIVATQPRRREIHVIADNLSTHKTQDVQAFLTAHPSVHLHFTPTYSSWLNQVELWFAKIERDLLARGIFTSVPDLARKIRRYIARYNVDPKPIRWTYSNPAHRITTRSAGTVH
jgi:transposase